MKPSVLIVDDEQIFRVLAENALTAEGFEVRSANGLGRARRELDRAAPDVILLDRRLPDGDGLDLLRKMRADGQSGSLVIVVTAYADIANAVEALQAGAIDYLAKPVQPTDLVLKLRKALEVRGLRDRLMLSREQQPKPKMEPKSPLMQSFLRTLEQLSVSPLTPVLLTGPSGSGKQHAAETLHALTYPPLGAEAPFVDVNCAAIPSDLIEGTLFGWERGAFTDAKAARRGLIEMADHGSLFLDEIAELPEQSQAKLLKFLDSMRFRRLGGEREIDVSVRVIAATNRDVEECVKQGRFREDLYHRLSVFILHLPPLALRREEIPALAALFLEQCSRRVKKTITGISEEALQALADYDFPGNVRELRNIIERAVILAADPLVSARDIVLPSRALRANSASAFFSVELGPDGTPPEVREIERAYVLRVLQHKNGQRRAAADALGISYPTFLKRLRELGIEPA
ncbi:MAG TPA: sigma-54 dependent transcriptional regulator [Polyangiaceae bacterium]|nr:sigma-54 dependent transcriptional regulator [Polyangiaceae bacterium]